MRAWKLQECVAHSPGGVTCVCLGRKSGRVMATGGDDRRVKLWAVGKPSCILSLTGHTSSIESTEFSQEEDRVAAGSLSGSIRIWDLEQVKIVRTLSGHSAGINSLDFHPFGNFVSSGASDTLVKLWDVSRKGCINTYRGHSAGVNMVRFSPDGKWVVSGGEDGAVKLWDLSAGRLLAELTGNTGSVRAVAFHPTVLLLATASADHTVRVYDLENFTQVAVSGSELLATTDIRQIAFHPDGVCLYVATVDHLKIYDYETMSCLETVHVGWRTGGGLDDMAIAPSFNQLVGVSSSGCTLSTYVVDVKACIPFTGEDTAAKPKCMPADPLTCQQPQYDRPCVDPNSGAVASDSDRHSYARCLSTNSNLQAKHRKSFCLTVEDNSNHRLQEDVTDPESQVPYKASLDEQTDLSTVADITDPDAYDRIFKPNRTVPRSPPRPTQNSADSCSPDSMNRQAKPSAGIIRKPFSPCLKRNEDEEPFAPPPPPPPPPSCADQVSASKDGRPTSSSSPSGTDERSVKPVGSSPVIVNSRGASKPDCHNEAIDDRPTEPTDAEWLSNLRKPHNPFMGVMSSRVKHLSTIQMMWSRDNIRTALETALVVNDPAILVDVLGILSQNGKLWTLDLAHLLLPHLLPLLKSKYSRHVETTCQVVHIILKNFAQIIRQTLDSPGLPGVDLIREERQQKCQDCMNHLLEIRSTLDSADVASRAGSCGKELLVRFQILA